MQQLLLPNPRSSGCCRSFTAEGLVAQPQLNMNVLLLLLLLLLWGALKSN